LVFDRDDRLWPQTVGFGFIGVFLGPVLPAVGYALLQQWPAHRPPRDDVMPPQA
jgi:predicted PurR-regulated permease PerM